MTVSQTVIIRGRSGLHARPATRFVEEARRYSSELLLEKDGQPGNCKSLLSLLKLGINQDSTIRIQATGPDEEVALAGLVALLNQFASEEAEGR